MSATRNGSHGSSKDESGSVSRNSFGARGTLDVGGASYEIFRLSAVEGWSRLPFSLKVLLENLLRNEDGLATTQASIRALAGWDATAEPDTEIQFVPGRVVMQDYTGVPCVVDLAAMRNAMASLGGAPSRVNPQVPAELVIDHSVVADLSGTPDAFERNVELEYQRNEERYQFLRWGQTAFNELKVVPPGTGIVHQVNIEHLARVVMVRGGQAYPDTLVGTDSHTTTVNGLGVLGWGSGGIEAEVAMLGQPVSMLIPRVVGFELSGELPAGSTATDLVLTITEMLRRHGVVGKFVEFHGEGVGAVPLANRATIGNMSPEFGSTCAIFPIDDETLAYLRFTGRSHAQVALVEAYAKEQGLWHDPGRAGNKTGYSESLALDLSTVVPSIAGPKRPQDRIALDAAKASFRKALPTYVPHDRAGLGQPVDPGARPSNPVPVTMADGTEVELDHGAVAVAAITSCTNTSNPSVMIGAGLLARNAVERGLERRPWVKTSLAPGSKVVMDYYERSGLLPYLEKLGFNLVGYGCTTCIGNSGPLPEEISAAINDNDLAVAAVLSGNRNFEGRIHPDVKMNYLASPPLVVAYALAGTMDLDLGTEPLGTDPDGMPVYLSDIWPSPKEIQSTIDAALSPEQYTEDYADVFAGDERWTSLPTPEGETFTWDDGSTYVRKPPYFEGMSREPAAVEDISGARVLLKLGDSVTTDHISPAGPIKADSPAGRYLREHGVERKDFNSYGSRRGNHEVMIRGTFANIRLQNLLPAGSDVSNPAASLDQGGWTADYTDGGKQAAVYDAAQHYAAKGTPLVVLAGKDYGFGSARDWAAKGTRLLGVRAVIAESYERIHRTNLVDLGVLPLQYPAGHDADSLGLTGTETFHITGITALNGGGVPDTVQVTARPAGSGDPVVFDARVRIDTPSEANYYRHGGILPYVLRRMLGGPTSTPTADER